MPLCLLPALRFYVPMLHVAGGGCPGSPAALLLPQSITIVTTQVTFGNVCSVFRVDVCLLWDLLGLLSFVMPSPRRQHTGPLVSSLCPPWSYGSGFCKSHWQLNFPACCWVSIQKYQKQRHFQIAFRHQEESKVSKQLYWTLTDI